MDQASLFQLKHLLNGQTLELIKTDLLPFKIQLMVDGVLGPAVLGEVVVFLVEEELKPEAVLEAVITHHLLFVVQDVLEVALKLKVSLVILSLVRRHYVVVC